MEEVEQYISNLEQDGKDKQNKINELHSYTSSAIGSQDPNLIVWQLELDNIIEKIEHLLRGDIIKDDGEGGIAYVAPKDTKMIVFNDFGVQFIMSIISSYLNRNTILSNYREERIFEILEILGNEIADASYPVYEKMGLDTVEKKSRYVLLIISILNMIESAYNRAIGGNELDSLRSARVVTQTQPLGSAPSMPMQPRKHFGGALNPRNWGR